MKISTSPIEQLLLAGPTCRGPAQCKHSPWTIKGRVHSLDGGSNIQGSDTQAYAAFHSGSRSQYNSQVDVGCYAPAARTTLNLHVPPVFICPPIERS
jgi:hypothetical protein